MEKLQLRTRPTLASSHWRPTRARWRTAIGVGTGVGALVAAATIPVGAAEASATEASAVAGVTANATAGWTVYHGNGVGSGVFEPKDQVGPATLAWQSPTLSGDLFGEPLVDGDLVYVATTADVVYALNSSNGTVAWSQTLGTPVPSSDLPCGDVTPTVGVVGTPVIDTARNEIFMVADELVNGTPAHYLVGLSTTNGDVMLDQDVDPSGAYTPAILQRTGLNLDDGNVVFGYGGNDGDCSSYHGWVVSVPEAGGTATDFEVENTAGASQGAVWMGGADPEVDSSGDVWVATGNGSTSTGASPYDSDSVIDLSSSLQVVQEFTPSTWQTDNTHDYDLGSTSPVLLPDGQVIQAGKSQTAYVLKASALGGIGGQESEISPICGTTFDGGSASGGNLAVLPCRNGPIGTKVNPTAGTMTVEWTASISNAGPPIMAYGSVWDISQGGTLYSLDPKTGAVTQQLSLGSEANHFPTPSIGDGLLLAPAANSVFAYTP